MADSAPDHDEGRAANPDADASSPPPRSGLTRFLVDGPAAAGISRETLIEAVRSLLRERDYLRRARDLQLADFQEESRSLREHVEELEEQLQREAQAAEGQADELKREVASLQLEREALRRERTALHADHDEIRADREDIRADRDAIRADRDMWRACVRGSLTARVRRALGRLAGRRPPEPPRGSGTQPTGGDDPGPGGLER